ncbi:MAG TPA: calcium-binding protein, partial [Bradyrhizobium sp.]|nr:calcium-binding protein [Bradyrhizobium sp.]
TYVFNRGDGQDTILDSRSGQNPWWGGYDTSTRTDTVQFGAGIAASDLNARRSGNDLVLTITDPANSATADQITLKNWTLGNQYHIETLAFADGTMLGTSDTEFDTSGSDLVSGTSADSLLFAGAGDDVLQGGAGNDLVSDTSGNNLLDGGAGNDWLSGGSGNDLLMGRAGNDSIKTGAGTGVLAFNAGDGNDTVDAIAGTNHAISLGGGIRYADLTLGKQNDNLVVETGNGESLTLKNWYAAAANHTVLNLQVVAEAMAGYDANSSDPLLNKKVETFDFQGLVGAFDAARAADPGITSWALTNALAQYHLSGSDDAALGGDLAYQYGLNGSLAGIGLTHAQDALNDPQFGAQAQALHPLSSLQDGAVRLS